MCGIAGIWGNATPERLRAMADSLRHRGPDDEGYWTHPQHGIGLAHRRLSIIDLTTGKQPVFNEDGRVVTVLNGEIYNYLELREDLVARGHRFSTGTDTEVIVHLYEDYGVDCVRHLRGMFAIALWDDQQRQLVLVRDRAGKKPLYYSARDGEFCFASEIKALVAAGATAFEIEPQSLMDYLFWGSVHAPLTIYRQVYSLEPAELVVVRDRRVVRKETYWRLEMRPKVKLSFAEAVEQLDHGVREAVRLRLRSDVPVGSFLSGGIDSGIVTAMAAQEYPGALTTLTIGFEDAAFDERPLARLVAERYATAHHEVLIRPDVAAVLPRIAAAYDQPFFDSSAIPTYFVSQAARSLVKVMLSGDGGDEVFCGYRRHVAAQINRMLLWADTPFWRPLWRLAGSLLPVPRGFRTAYAFVHRFVRGMGMEPYLRHLAWTTDCFTDEELSHFVKPDSRIGQCASGARLAQRQYARLADLGPLDRMLVTDFLTVLAPDLLVKMDIASMAHGLETRSPLLDHVLIDTASRYPEDVKLRGTRTKPLLRALAQRYLPLPVQRAKKRGFEVPLIRWLREDLRPLCDDVLLSRNGLLAELFERAHLERLIREEAGLDPRRWANRVWLLLMLGVWDAHVRPRKVGTAAVS
ncbi:MAG: asparagine synthase (glutamine-hydrolyzing) [Planctomycetota bacterium]